MAQQNGASAGDLLKQFSEDATTLIRKEVELAKAELTEKGKQAGRVSGCSAAPASSASVPSGR
jgi:hypothetical protein